MSESISVNFEDEVFGPAASPEELYGLRMAASGLLEHIPPTVMQSRDYMCSDAAGYMTLLSVREPGQSERNCYASVLVSTSPDVLPVVALDFGPDDHADGGLSLRAGARSSAKLIIDDISNSSHPDTIKQLAEHLNWWLDPETNHDVTQWWMGSTGRQFPDEIRQYLDETSTATRFNYREDFLHLNEGESIEITERRFGYEGRSRGIGRLGQVALTPNHLEMVYISSKLGQDYYYTIDSNGRPTLEVTLHGEPPLLNNGSSSADEPKIPDLATLYTPRQHDVKTIMAAISGIRRERAA